MENQQSAGEAQNSQKKVWYKSGWGLVIAIIFFPYFLLWYMWAKTNWGKTLKITITIVFVFFNLVALMSDNPNKNTSQQAVQQAEQKPVIAETKNEAPAIQQPQAPQFVFDIPALIGKNIDEVVQSLGSPSAGKEPTKQQLATGVADEWYKEFTKDDVTVLVTYNAKTKVVSDFFFDGEDKAKIMEAGNLKENSGGYNLELVKNILDPNKITGIKVSKKLPEELDANVTYSSNAFKIENNEDYAWSGCKFEINGGGKIFSGGYEYKSSTGIKAKDNIVIPFSEFTKDSQRFNFYSEKPENLFISCNTNGQSRTNYFTIN